MTAADGQPATSPDAAAVRVPGSVTVRVPDSAARRVIAGYVGEARLSGELEDCVGRLLNLASAEPLIASPQLAELAAGGTRLRPLFVLAAAHSAARDLAALLAERAVRSAVVIELLHLASLVHDDVMDEAATRHGVATVNAREGNIRAVLAGDYLLAQSLAAASALGRSEAAIASRTFVRLCEGQARESAALYDPGRTEADYYAAITAKTGALFEASFRLGALAGSLGLKPAAALAEYGVGLGVAYQILDDVSDLTATPGQLGKPGGHDIIEGVYTLPVLRALRDRPQLAEVLRDPDRAAAAEQAAALVREGDGIESALDDARRHAVRAIDALAGAARWISAGAVDMLAELAEELVPATSPGTTPAVAGL
jgi:geranylgeranyl pyrophosphate synthase